MKRNIAPYVTINESEGAKAVVYYVDDLIHKIEYLDSKGNQFYAEEFEKTPIELVVKSAIDWAEGRRDLVMGV